jgi:hypothetical protein
MRPSTVWMVSAKTGVTGRKGTLSLQADSVVFRPASTAFGDTIIPLKALRRVRRVRGSPVLELHAGVRDQPPVIAFYFVQPPDLSPPEDLRIRFLPKRTARKEAITQLRQGNLRKRAEIAAWAEAIDRARRG